MRQFKKNPITRIILVILSAFLFLTICITLWRLTNQLTFDFTNEVKGPYQDQEHSLYLTNDFSSDTILKLNTYKKEVIHVSSVNILGTRIASQVVHLIVNDQEIDKVLTDLNGCFKFSNIKLSPGINDIEVGDLNGLFKNTYYLVIQDQIGQSPEIISYHINEDTSQIEIIGIGEADSLYNLNLYGHAITVETDNYGTFYQSIEWDSLKSTPDKKEAQVINFKNNRAIFQELPPITLHRKIELFQDSSGKYTQLKLFAQLPATCILSKRLDMGSIGHINFINKTFGKIYTNEEDLYNENLETDWDVHSTKIINDSSLVKINIILTWKENADYSNFKGIFIKPEESSLSENPLFSLHDSLILHLSDKTFFSLSHPTNYTGENMKAFTGYKEITDHDFFKCLISNQTYSQSSYVRFQKNLDERFSKSDPLPDNFIEVIRQLPNKFFALKIPKILAWLLYGLLLAIPFIWLLTLLKEYQQRFGIYFQNFSTIVMTLFFFFIIEFFYNAIIRFIDPILYKISYLNLYMSLDPENGLLLILLFLPIVAKYIKQDKELTYQKRKSNISSIMIWIGAFLFFLFYGYLIGDKLFIDLLDFLPTKYTRTISIACGILLLTIVIIILVSLLRSILRNSLNINLKTQYILGPIIIFLVYNQLFDKLNLLMNKFIINVVWTLFAGFIGTVFLISIYKLCLKIFPGRKQVLSKGNWALLALCFAFLATPKGLIFNTESIYFANNINLFYQCISTLFIYIILLIILVFLFYDSKANKQNLDGLTFNLGILLLSVYVVDYTTYSWFYIPISLIIAYLIIRRLIFQNPDRINEQLDKYKTILDSPGDSIEKVINYLSFKRQYNGMLKSIDKKLSDGECDYKTWKDKNIEYKNQIAALKSEASYQETDLRNIIFSLNSKYSQWDYSISAVKIGILLAIPIIFFTIRDFRLSDTNINYPLLSVIDDLLKKVLQWIILAFCFGYFYNLIKGRTGIEKGLWLSFMFLVARIGPAILFADNLNDIASLLTLGVEISIYCLLLGFFAFDFMILRKNGYGWMDVKVLYNLAFFSTFGSTLLIALVGVFSGKLQDLFTSLLDLIF